MWGYQPHFRVELELRAEKVLKQARCNLKPKAILVGVRDTDSSTGFPVCVEPEDGPWDTALFSGCHRRAEEIYESHTDHNMFYGDEPSMRDKGENIRKSSVRQAVEEVTSEYDSKHGTVSFCGRPTVVENYHIVPVLEFDKMEFDKYPRLLKPFAWNEFRVSSSSLLDSLIKSLLTEATEALVRKDPGRFFDLMRRDPSTILQESAADFCVAIAIADNCIRLQDAFEMLNAISALSYEGSSAGGSIVFGPILRDVVETRVSLKRSVPLQEHKLVRKLIETNVGEVVCLHEGDNGIVGLGEVLMPRHLGFHATFTGHYQWALYFGETLLMQSSYGRPHFSVDRLSRDEFEGLSNRLFKGIGRQSLDRLWSIVNSATEQKHGALIVISEGADKEVDRLLGQCLAVDPKCLDPGDVHLLSNIDGAILLDHTGVCHAIGVILDGLPSNQADMSRGARYNSALRYIGSAGSATLCVVVSEDGYVDLLPDIRPQILRSEIKEHIELLMTQTPDNYHKTRSWLDEHRFYLSEEECEVANKAMHRIETAPTIGTEVRIVTPVFSPDPAMNDSYYLSED